MAGQWGSAFPRWSFLESRGQVPNPFGTSLAPFTMKRTKVILKGFGTWPHFSNMDQSEQNRGQVPNPFGTSLTPFKMKRTKMTLKRVWNLPQFFQHEQKWKSRGQVPNTFETSLAPFKMNEKRNDYKKGLEPDPMVPTWTKVEKQRPGSKPIWDQLGPFQNEKD